MSYKEGDEIHIEDDDAMAGESTGHVRWILGVSLLAAIAILSAVWIFGAFSQGDAEEEITMSGTEEYENASAAEEAEGDAPASDDDTLADDAVVTPGDEELVGPDTEG